MRNQTFLHLHQISLMDIIKPLSTFLYPELSIELGNIIVNFWEHLETNPGLLRKKQERFLCAWQSQQPNPQGPRLYLGVSQAGFRGLSSVATGHVAEALLRISRHREPGLVVSRTSRLQPLCEDNLLVGEGGEEGLEPRTVAQVDARASRGHRNLVDGGRLETKSLLTLLCL